MLEDALLRTLEDYGLIAAVATQGAGVAADCKLVRDLRRFEADYVGNALPAATIEVNAKLLHAIDQDIVASRTFLQAEPAAGPTWPRCRTPSRAGSASSATFAGWVPVTGQGHDGATHPMASRGDR
jgi:cholesterol transport system auxiliary component